MLKEDWINGECLAAEGTRGWRGTEGRPADLFPPGDGYDDDDCCDLRTSPQNFMMKRGKMALRKAKGNHLLPNPPLPLLLLS